MVGFHSQLVELEGGATVDEDDHCHELVDVDNGLLLLVHLVVVVDGRGVVVDV